MMNSRVSTRLQSMEVPMKYEKVELQGSEVSEAAKRMASRRASMKERKMALQQDVDKLKKKLRQEVNVHRALERAFNRPLGVLPRLPPYLPTTTFELLAEVAVLEEEVVRLEEQVVNYRKGLYQEAVYISSSKRNVENSVDCYKPCRFKTPKSEQSKNLPSLTVSVQGKENQMSTNATVNSKGSSLHKADTVKTPVKQSPKKLLDPQRFQLCSEHENVEAKTPMIQDEKAFGDDNPNRISENILTCLLSIFVRMSSIKNKGTVETICNLSTHECSEETEFRDPYGISYEFGKRDIGPYKQFSAIEASSINPKRAANCIFLACRLKLLLGKLANVELQTLSHQEKLAFWINIYNSCMMNAFLEEGVPDSPEMVVTLMQKATINVGGHLLNAITIEHFILRLPYQSEYTFYKGPKTDDMKARRIIGLDLSEPLVTFALSCGSWSSPVVRVYTAAQVENELEVAKREYLQAAVGILTDKFVIPKLLVWYLLDFAKDLESMRDWICLQLPNELGTEAIKCLEERKSNHLSQFVQVMPYDFSFRYLLSI